MKGPEHKQMNKRTQVEGGSKPQQLSLLYDRTNFHLLLDDELNKRNTREACACINNA